jgi:hypothetical protein
MKLISGIVCILIGALVIYIHYKSPKTEFSEGNITSDFRGYGSGIGLIAVGIAFIIDWFSS